MADPDRNDRPGRGLLQLLVILYGVLTLLAVARRTGLAGSPAPNLLVALDGWWCALTLHLCLTGLGRLLLGRCSCMDPERLPSTLRLTLASGCGYLAGTTILIAAGLAGPLAGIGGTLILVLLGAAGIGAAPACRRAWTAAGPTRPGGWSLPKVMWTLAALLLLLPLLLRSLLPESDWDATLYHLPMARAFLEQGIWSDSFPLVPCYRPGTAHLLYSLLLLADAEAGIIPFNLLLLGATLVGIQGAGTLLWGRRAGAWALGICLGLTVLIEPALDARVDTFLVFVTSLGGIFLLVRLHQGQGIAPVLLAAAMGGLAAGTKYNGLLLGLMLVGTAGLLLARSGVRRPALMVGLALLAALPPGVFYLRNGVLMGNPVYPFGPERDQVQSHRREILADLDRAKYADTETRRWIAGLTAAPPGQHRSGTSGNPALLLQAVGRDLVGLGEELAALARGDIPRWQLARHRITPHTTKVFHWVSPMLLLFLLLPLVEGRRRTWWLPALLLLACLALSWRTGTVRYLSPLFPLMALTGGAVLARIRHRHAVPALVVLAALFILRGATADWSLLAKVEALRHLAGGESRVDYLCRAGYNYDSTATPRMIRWLNGKVSRGELKPEHRIFMVAEGKGWLLECGYTPSLKNNGLDWLRESWRAGWDHDRLQRSLWAEGYRYIMVDLGWIFWNLQHARPDRRCLNRALNDLFRFLADRADPDRQVEGVRLYRIRRP